MSSRLLVRGAALFALTAGLVVFAAQAASGDHTSAVAHEPAPNTVAAHTAGGGESGVLNLNDLHDTGPTLGGGSKFQPGR
jgi:hypothetical protein